MKRFDAYKRRGLTWLLLTLPVWLVLLILMGISVYNTALELGRYTSLDGFGEVSWSSISEGWRTFNIRTQMRRQLRPDRNSPELLCIDIPVDQYKRLSENLPASGDEWMDMTVNGHLAKMSLRGSQELHWLGDPKSLDIKTKKDQLLYGFRRLPLSRKGVLNQHMAYWIASQVGLLSPETHIFDVFLNNSYYSPLLMIESLNSRMLLRKGRMPGPIFSGESFPQTKVNYVGLPRWLLLDAYLWGPQDVETSFQDKEYLSGVMESVLLAPPSRVYQRAAAHFDLLELQRMLALQLLFNDFHMDGWHNLRFYKSPFDGKLHPIWWDTFIIGNTKPGIPDWGTYKMNALGQALIRSPAFMRGVFSETERLTGEECDWVLKAKELEERYAQQVGLVPDTWSIISVSDLLRQSLGAVRGKLNRVDILAETVQVGSNTVLVLKQGGPGRVTLSQLKGQAGGFENLTCYQDSNRNGAVDLADKLISGAAQTGADTDTWYVETPPQLDPGYRFRGIERELASGMENEALDYFYILPHFRAEQLTEVVFTKQDGTPHRVPVEVKQDGPAVRSTYSVHPWAEVLDKEGRSYHFGGEKAHRISEDLIVEEADTVEIEAGAHFLLEEGVSMVFRTAVHMKGTAAKRIRFEPAEPGAYWGVLAFQGRAASGSSMNNVSVSGGSDDVIDGIYYSGMVNAFDCTNLTVRRCQFGRNYRGDDVFHAGQADVSIQQCEFSNARADAIDYDFSQGTIASCTFTNTGNDAIDLMESHLTIADNAISDAGDKGVSVGNRSRVDIHENRIEGCAIGVELKDDSRANLYGNRMISNEVAVRGYLKNGHYQIGGWGRMADNVLQSNGQDYSLWNGSFLIAGNHVFGEADESSASLAPQGTSPLLEAIQKDGLRLFWEYVPYEMGFDVASSVRLIGHGETDGAGGILSLRAGGVDAAYQLPIERDGKSLPARWVVSVIARYTPGEWQILCGEEAGHRSPDWVATGNGLAEMIFEGTEEELPERIDFIPQSILAEPLEVRSVEVWARGPE